MGTREHVGVDWDGLYAKSLVGLYVSGSVSSAARESR